MSAQPWTLTVEHPGAAPISRWLLPFTAEPSAEMIATDALNLDTLLLGVLWADTLDADRAWRLEGPWTDAG